MGDDDEKSLGANGVRIGETYTLVIRDLPANYTGLIQVTSNSYISIEYNTKVLAKGTDKVWEVK